MTFSFADGYLVTHSFMTCRAYSYCGFYTYAEQFTILSSDGT